MKIGSFWRRVPIVAILLFVPLALANDAIAQKARKYRERRILLTLNADINGFKITEPARQEYRIQIFRAEDPVTKRRLSGEELVEYKCREMLEIVTRKILFNEGNTGVIGIECREIDLIVTPRILIREDAE